MVSLMTTGQIIVTIVLGVLSNLITLALVSILKWQLTRMALPEDFPGLRARFQFWFYQHLDSIVLTGIIVDLVLLAFVLIKFPTVTVWTVLVIVFCVVVMAFQLAIYILIRVLKFIFNWILKGIAKTVEADEAS